MRRDLAPCTSGHSRTVKGQTQLLEPGNALRCEPEVLPRRSRKCDAARAHGDGVGRRKSSVTSGLSAHAGHEAFDYALDHVRRALNENPELVRNNDDLLRLSHLRFLTLQLSTTPLRLLFTV